jgi:hypothetical protein
MSVIRQGSFLGQSRIDTPHLRALESSIAADFDLLAGRILAGSRGLVVSGFDILTVGAVGSPAVDLQLNVAGGVIIHPQASESGSIFFVPAGTDAEVLSTTNAKVVGSFTSGQVNYVGIDLSREADATTTDLVMFLDANTLLETPKSVPLARTLQYSIVISTTDFAATPNVLPIANVTIDSFGNVSALEDARNLAYRLGTGGSVPDKLNTYSWSGGRNELTQDEAGSVFAGGDKSITSLKDWTDAVSTRLWEVGGGEFWYSPTSDRDLKVVYTPTVLASNNDNYDWDLGSETLSWSGVEVVFANSTGWYNTVTDGSDTLADGDCLYVDVDRSASGTALTAVVATMATLGSPTIPGSRFILAWRRGDCIYIRDRQYEVNREINVASPTVLGTLRLSRNFSGTDAVAPVDATSPVAIGSHGGTIIATGTNKTGLTVTGSGTATGVAATGGSTGPGGIGVTGTGGGTSAGVAGYGATIGAGVMGYGGASGGSSASGVYGEGFLTASGVRGQGGPTAGSGLYGVGGAAGIGVQGVGGTTSGIGVSGTGVGTGTGVVGQGGGAATVGLGGSFTGGTATSGNVVGGGGLLATGGAGYGTDKDGGVGATLTGGVGTGSGYGGIGAIITGGSGADQVDYFLAGGAALKLIPTNGVGLHVTKDSGQPDMPAAYFKADYSSPSNAYTAIYAEAEGYNDGDVIYGSAIVADNLNWGDRPIEGTRAIEIKGGYLSVGDYSYAVPANTAGFVGGSYTRKNAVLAWAKVTRSAGVWVITDGFNATVTNISSTDFLVNLVTDATSASTFVATASPSYLSTIATVVTGASEVEIVLGTAASNGHYVHVIVVGY